MFINYKNGLHNIQYVNITHLSWRLFSVGLYLVRSLEQNLEQTMYMPNIQTCVMRLSLFVLLTVHHEWHMQHKGVTKPDIKNSLS